ncbi:amylo-alpha-1,6-glucosidase [Planomonospora sphaerica]|uniref:Amylo-alpha-1,6-glucosidase n=1 Tax=Planomonospora sphaerica TaxID=161355 RepID=A0A161LL38_9ACTN|nr:amylo-alpha-1,6-glucosidase [Planomonospora sphaerica]
MAQEPGTFHIAETTVNAWTFEGQPGALGGTTVTLVEGGSFCVSTCNGDITPGGAQGLYHADTRLVSRLELKVDEAPIESLRTINPEPYHAIFLGRTGPRPGQAESTMLVIRDRYVGGGLREDLTLRNMSDEAAGCTIALHIGSDLADLFEVKGGRVMHVADVEMTSDISGLLVASATRGRGARIMSNPMPTATMGLLSFRVVVPARGDWTVALQVNPIVDGEETPAWFSAHHPVEHAEPARRRADWERLAPVVTTSNRTVAQVLAKSKEDLGSLRLFEEDKPGEPPSVAAGAPWFMTLFGRDSLLTSWMALPMDQSLALGTLRRLARVQGRAEEPLSEEEPGKIMHELRFGVQDGVSAHDGHVYFGSVDSTPLFVMLLGELRRWGLYEEAVEELLPHADAALDWITRSADPFLYYRRKTDHGLLNQGWKDSVDGVNFADGTLARPPIALAEVQGYVYAAYIARSHFAREAGDPVLQEQWIERAMRLRDAFDEMFWLPDRGYYAMGLDRAGRPIDGLGSNMGHCLWTGIVNEERAASVAEHLLSPEMFTGFGIRTLASSMGAYNPMSYHNGSVWPHDSALVTAGLMRYGFEEEARQVAFGLLDAAKAFNWRLPELFCGFGRDEFPEPVPFPTSCAPQAWASAAPIQLMRSLLRLDPCVPQNKVWMSPVGLTSMKIAGLQLAGARVTVDVDGGEVAVTGLPEHVTVVGAPRPPLTAVLEEIH